MKLCFHLNFVLQFVQDLMEPKPILELNANLGILQMNSNCFAIFFSSILVMSVQIFIFVGITASSLDEEQNFFFFDKSLVLF